MGLESRQAEDFRSLRKQIHDLWKEQARLKLLIAVITVGSPVGTYFGASKAFEGVVNGASMEVVELHDGAPDPDKNVKEREGRYLMLSDEQLSRLLNKDRDAGPND